MSEYKIILLTTYPNLLSYKALPGNMIDEMKICLSTHSFFKLFEIVILQGANNDQSFLCFTNHLSVHLPINISYTVCKSTFEIFMMFLH